MNTGEFCCYCCCCCCDIEAMEAVCKTVDGDDDDATKKDHPRFDEALDSFLGDYELHNILDPFDADEATHD